MTCKFLNFQYQPRKSRAIRLVSFYKLSLNTWKSYEYICLEEKFYDSAFFLVLLILIIKIGTAQLHAQNNVHVQNIYIFLFIF